MDLEYKPDWELSKARIAAFWHGEDVGRPLISVTAPNGKTPRTITAPATVVEQALDFEYRIDVEEENIRCTYYGGEAVPSVWPDFGPNIMAAFLGGGLKIAQQGGSSLMGSFWSSPVIEDWERDFPQIGFHPENIWWKRTLEFTQQAVERSKGKYLVTIPDIAGGADTCDALRGSDRFLMDLYLQPEWVQRLLNKVNEAMQEVLPRLCGELSRYEEGCVSTYRQWAPGPFYALRSDISYLIDPRMLADQFVPQIITEGNILGPYQMFHTHSEDYDTNRQNRLDYLDAILSLPDLKMVEWRNPSGDPEGCRRILQAGKGIIMVVGSPKDIPTIVETLGSNRLWFITFASSPEEADTLVNMKFRI